MLLRGTSRLISSRLRRVIRLKPSTTAKLVGASILLTSPVETATVRRSYSDMSSSDPTQFVDNAINKDPVVVFSKSWCPYCAKVKKLFSEIGVKATVYELDQMPDGDAIQKALQAKSSQKTVPNVYIGQKHVGGSDNTHAAKANGSLKKLLTEAGISDAKL
eukprot:TRINITY_DN7602_c0_g1_i1.p1 TRINITY_DN7602_c0_g1~~TRINITY_DN7602_c0_g1_i1.p1  ORF type:complete len:161 (-),score=36.48 TRINITY_DN7602_c0_g1_i1:19-501(-)